MYDGTRTLDDGGRKKYVNRSARRQGKADYITPWKYLNQPGDEEGGGEGRCGRNKRRIRSRNVAKSINEGKENTSELRGQTFVEFSS